MTDYIVPFLSSGIKDRPHQRQQGGQIGTEVEAWSRYRTARSRSSEPVPGRVPVLSAHFYRFPSILRHRIRAALKWSHTSDLEDKSEDWRWVHTLSTGWSSLTPKAHVACTTVPRRCFRTGLVKTGGHARISCCIQRLLGLHVSACYLDSEGYLSTNKAVYGVGSTLQTLKSIHTHLYTPIIWPTGCPD